MTLRVYTPAPHDLSNVHALLAHRWSGKAPWRGVFDEGLPPNFFEGEAQFVDTINEADVVVLPDNFARPDREAHRYIATHADQAHAAGKPLFLFCFGDLNDQTRFDPRVWVFRLSVYKSTMGPRDIVVPTTAQSFDASALRVREKADIPTVSFCGYAGHKTPRQWAAYALKNVLWDLKALVRPALRARKEGIYWRRRAMRALQSSRLVRTRFVVRRSFSGARRTIELDPTQARTEFIDSIVESDFVLAPKGYGNYSNRFLEALSLGRIPVLIDTDVVLPCEEEIEYDKIVVRVPMDRVADCAEFVRTFYDSLSAEAWQERQRLAHDTYEQYLRQDVFLRDFFDRFLHNHGQRTA